MENIEKIKILENRIKELNKENEELKRINKISEFNDKLHEELILKYDNLQIEYSKLYKKLKGN